MKGYESIQELTHYDFQMMGFGDIHGQGKDLSGLVFDPKIDGLKVVNSKKKYSYVCSHKRQHKPGKYCRLQFINVHLFFTNLQNI